tara:strand:+ start:342 stop:827 length:486 start_codon:yes stop_codon:yes gene_type:complete
MDHSTTDNKLIEQVLMSTKTIAMVGVSSVKKELDPKVTRRKPSIIVMKYLQEFGYKILPVNPLSAGKKIQGEITFAKLEDISTPVDIVNVFRPSSETPKIAEQTVKIGAKVLWLQYGIQNEEAKKIVESANMAYIANKCIKQEYQRLFLKVNPVFPVLKAD